jgi:hypothetical protein
MDVKRVALGSKAIEDWISTCFEETPKVQGKLLEDLRRGFE